MTEQTKNIGQITLRICERRFDLVSLPGNSGCCEKVYFHQRYLITDSSITIVVQVEAENTRRIKLIQDGPLEPAYFSQEHKYFDQHLPTANNETIV